MSNQKRTARALATAAAGSMAGSMARAMVLLAAPAAHAEVVDVNYQCQTPIGPKGAVSPIDIKSVRSGSGYRLTMSFRKGVSSSPVELGKGAMNPSAVIELGGAERGRVKVSGPANAAAIPANTPIKISDLSGIYTPGKSGKVTFTAGGAHHQGARYDHDVHPQEQPGTVAEARCTGRRRLLGLRRFELRRLVRRCPGRACRWRSTAEDRPPFDSVAALGTLGGTVLLTGAAGVLWLTRRGQRATG